MKKSICILLTAFCLLLLLPLTAYAADLPLLYDEADLLTDAEEARLLSRLESLSRSAGMDVAIAFVESTEELSPMEYADDYFDYNGFGQGADRDGLVLLVSMEYRDWWISTRGYGITAFTDAGIEYIGEQVTPFLGSGEYAAACEQFVLQCESFIAQAKAGDPFDVHNLPKEPFDKGMALIISLIGGLIIAWIYTAKLKSQLFSVHKQAAAGSYVKRNSLNVSNSRDFFLYRNVQTRARETSSSGGSSTHRSSSGATHGGGGGKF